MKPHDLGTTKISGATQNQYTTLILTVVDHQKTRRRTMEHLRKKVIREPPTKYSCRAAKEVVHKIGVEVTVETLTHSNLRIACTMIMKSITASKIAPFFSSQKEKWSKNLQSLRSNLHPKKSIIPCNGPLTISNTLHPTLHISTAAIPKHPNPTSGILPILPLCHNQSPVTIANSSNNVPSTSSTNNVSSSSSANYLSNVKQH
jgi:hypothetical protein